jgi:hypothetical protein
VGSHSVSLFFYPSLFHAFLSSLPSLCRSVSHVCVHVQVHVHVHVHVMFMFIVMYAWL